MKAGISTANREHKLLEEIVSFAEQYVFYML